MPDDTTILSLPLILPAQAQKHVTHNEALVKLDLMVQLAVINRTLTTPPPLPTLGDRHIVAVGATGPWVGQAGRIAMYTQAGWQFTQALPGWQAYVMAEQQMAFFDGLGWIALSDGPFTVGRLGVSATSDATNRLAVSAPATLLNHAGSGHQLKLNKAVGSDTASLLFQTGFGGRAEMGTAGSDDFSIKVSADGSAWSVALEADAATGEVTLPQPVHLGGQAADPVAPVDGTLWLNTTTGEVKVQSAGVTQVVGGGGGGVGDGDKGDIAVSGSGANWTIDAGVVSLDKLADIATGRFLGRETGGTGAPEVLTPAQARNILNVADGATANATDASLRDRATHTGTQGAATITGLASVATSGSASDLTAGMLPPARFDDTAHGNRSGGGSHSVATGSVAGFMAAADKAKLDAITGSNTGDQTITLIGDVTGSGTGSFGATIAAGAVTNAKLADVASGTFKGRTTAGTGDPEDLTAAQATALLDVFGGAAKGLAPASGGGTVNFLRADGTWAVPAGGGGSPGGASGEMQYNNGGAFAGAPDVGIEDGQLRLPSISTPAAPASGGLKIYAQDMAGRILPTIMGPSGLEMALQPHLGGNRVSRWTPASNSTAAVLDGFPAVSAQGTATAFNWAATSRRTRMAMIEYLNGTASTTAIAGLRTSVARWTVGAATAGDGGFHLFCTWGTATGIAATSATHRGFCGLRTGNPSDANPSSLANIVGMGWDSADANLQFLHNDGSGTATKIDLGAGFPRPAADRGDVYELALFSPPGTTQMVGYRVRNLLTGAVASGVVTTNLPATTQALGWGCHISVGGTSSIIGAAVMGVYVETDF